MYAGSAVQMHLYIRQYPYLNPLPLDAVFLLLSDVFARFMIEHLEASKRKENLITNIILPCSNRIEMAALNTNSKLLSENIESLVSELVVFVRT